MIDWFARNPVAANLLMVMILVLGGWSMTQRLPLEVFPEFERDIVNIAVTYRGASPEEVEEAAVIRIEEAVADLNGIESIISSAFEGQGLVQIEVQKGRNPREILDDVKNKVDAITTFPDEVERPIFSVQEFRREVISVVVAADLPEESLGKLGERVRDDLINLPEVTQVELTGVRPFEISIELGDAALERFGLTFDQVAAAIRRHSVDLPAGSLRTLEGEITLRTKAQAYRGADFGRIPLLTRDDGTRLTLGEIAVIRDGFEEEPLFSHFNGNPAVLIEVYRTGQQNAMDIGAAVRRYVEESQANFAPGVSVDYWRDRSQIVRLRLETLLTSAWQGGLLVFLCLTLFLRLSVAIWVCVGIPISFMGALILMPQFGVTINIITLFAFILVLGIVVDDAIITGENIYRRMKEGGVGLESAILGTQEVSVPVTFGLLTTVAAFLPLMFMEGQRGPIFAQIPLVVIPVLLFSWVESKLILPTHLAHLNIHKEDQPGRLQRFQQAFANGLERGVDRYYQPFLEWSLNHRYLTFVLFAGFSFLVITFVASGRFGFTFFPRVQSETARATLTMQTGTAVERTEAHAQRMEAVAVALQNKYRDPQSGESVIRNVLTSVGWQAGRSSRGGDSQLAQISLELVPPEERTMTVNTSDLVREWRMGIGAIPGAKELNYRAEIGRGGNPVEVQLMGQNFDQLSSISVQIREWLTQYDGVFDIQDSFEKGKPEITLSLRPEAELLGLSARDLGQQVRQAFFGTEAQRIQRGRDDVRVMIRLPLADRKSLSTLEGLRIRTPDGHLVPMETVAHVALDQGFATIRRVDRNRAVNVMADAEKGRVNVNAIAAELRVFLDELMVRYPGVRYSFEGELKEQQDSFRSLLMGVGFVLFCIYGLLAVPLRSYSQPIVVMLVIPFSLVGAVLGHIILDMNLSLLSIMGMLALAGVVVNDSLVLVDWINRTVADGKSPFESARTAGAARFRPILLTSLTTFFGLTPLLLEKSTQAQFLIPMAVSLGFGILYATLLSLVLVPSGFLILEDIKRFGGKIFGRSG
ncbi:MAG: efflux RND transporter permease subunit [Magnetococcales bacterium]|nr:efflux RND transporter permease subunit [Magnetococcales bacterium]